MSVVRHSELPTCELHISCSMHRRGFSKIRSPCDCLAQLPCSGSTRQWRATKPPKGRALRAHVVLRSQFAGDRLAVAGHRGVTQYILLGTGFESFALRQPVRALPLRILEVDQEGTQTFKRTQLAAADLTVPENATFATIDFERETLRDGLLRYQVSLDEPTFFAWLGVTMYLKEDATDAVLRSVAAFPAGSEITLTYAPPPGDFPSPFDRRAESLGELLYGCCA